MINRAIASVCDFLAHTVEKYIQCLLSKFVILMNPYAPLGYIFYIAQTQIINVHVHVHPITDCCQQATSMYTG